VAANLKPNFVLGAIAGVLVAFPIASFVGLVYQFPVPFGSTVRGTNAIILAPMALAFIVIVSGMVVVLPVIGIGAALLAPILARTQAQVTRWTLGLSTIGVAVVVFAIPIADSLAQDARYSMKGVFVSAANRRQMDYHASIGIAQLRASGEICMAIPTALAPGREITLVSVPVAVREGASPSPDSVQLVSATVASSNPSSCEADSSAPGVVQPGDSLYRIETSASGVRAGANYFAVVLPFDRFFNAKRYAFARVSALDDYLMFRVCASAEGLHFTAWSKTPPKGKRLWHRYYDRKSDAEPSCIDVDYG
jgi:hypothetical protein